MQLQDESAAKTFDTKEECRKWISDRVVRFKLGIGTVVLSDGTPGISQQKKDGRIIDTTAEGYKPDGLDEPLKIYAKPVRNGDKWMAAMLYKQ